MKISNRQRRLAAQKELSLPVTAFTQVDLTIVSFVPKGMTRAYRNSRYTVMVYDNDITTAGPATRVMIQKYDDTPFLGHWMEMQKIKNEIFGREVMAIEYYPKESQLINDHNIYWMWIFPEGVIPIKVIQ